MATYTPNLLYLLVLTGIYRGKTALYLMVFYAVKSALKWATQATQIKGDTYDPSQSQTRFEPGVA